MCIRYCGHMKHFVLFPPCLFLCRGVKFLTWPPSASSSLLKCLCCHLTSVPLSFLSLPEDGVLLLSKNHLQPALLFPSPSSSATSWSLFTFITSLFCPPHKNIQIYPNYSLGTRHCAKCCVCVCKTFTCCFIWYSQSGGLRNVPMSHR